MALIHLCLGGDSPLGYVKNKVLLFFSATTVLSNKMIQLNRTTIWNDFSQYISKYMALKIWSLKYFEKCISYTCLYHPLALIATQSVFSYILSLGSITKNRKCTKWPRNDRERCKVKGTPYIYRESQISPRFALWSLIFQLIEFSVSPWGTMVNLTISEKIVKNRKLKISNNQTYFCEDHWEDNSEQVWKRLAAIWKESSVLKCSLPSGSRVKENIVKFSFFKISKIPNVVLGGPIWRKFRRKG